MSLSGTVRILRVKFVPVAVVRFDTTFAPKIRSVAFVVVAAPLLAVPLLVPPAPDVTSTGLAKSAPLYSKMRMSGNAAAPEKVTVTVFVPAAAARMFFA
jgi:hypothetical protein